MDWRSVAFHRGVGVAGEGRWAATVPGMPTARVNGITMYYEQHGAGEPLLLVNGLGADITLLAPLIAWFAGADRPVVSSARLAPRWSGAVGDGQVVVA